MVGEQERPLRQLGERVLRLRGPELAVPRRGAAVLRAGGGYLYRRIPMVRYDVAEPLHPLTVGSPLRVLG